jgi:hypothetical protein
MQQVPGHLHGGRVADSVEADGAPRQVDCLPSAPYHCGATLTPLGPLGNETSSLTHTIGSTTGTASTRRVVTPPRASRREHFSHELPDLAKYP